MVIDLNDKTVENVYKYNKMIINIYSEIGGSSLLVVSIIDGHRHF